MRNNTLILLVATTALLACSDPVDRAAEENNIREAMFRNMISEKQDLQGQSDHYYFLSIQSDGSRDYRDPSDEFMKRFNGNAPMVKKVSECADNAPRGVVDKASGTRGHILHLDRIKWLSDREVEMRWRDHTSGLNGYGGSCRLRWSVGNWILTSKKVETS